LSNTCSGLSNRAPRPARPPALKRAARARTEQPARVLVLAFPLFLFLRLLRRFDFPPDALYVARRFRRCLAENVGVPPHQLLVDGVQRVADMKQLLLGRHLRVEDRLQHEVAQFLCQIVPRAPVDGIEHFVSFFQRVRLDGVEGLFAIPRATARRAQAGHDRDQVLTLAGVDSLTRRGGSPI
jgi:hypothetical protein